MLFLLQITQPIEEYHILHFFTFPIVLILFYKTLKSQLEKMPPKTRVPYARQPMYDRNQVRRTFSSQVQPQIRVDQVQSSYQAANKREINRQTFEKILSRYTRIKISKLSELLKMNVNEMELWLLDLPIDYGFKIDDDILIIDQNKLGSHINDVFTSFETSGSKKTMDSGKKTQLIGKTVDDRRCCKLHGRMGDKYCNMCGKVIPDEWIVEK